MKVTTLELVALREFADVLTHTPEAKGKATPYELGLTMRPVRPLIAKGLLMSQKEAEVHTAQDECVISELGWKVLKENEL